MSNTGRWYAWFIITAAGVFTGGCVDAVRDGVTEGVSGGLAGLIESIITDIADTALGSA